MGCGASQSAEAAHLAKQKHEPVLQEKQQQDKPVLQHQQADSWKAPETASFTKFQLEVLVGHNKRRQWHQAPALKLSEELNAIAQKWADYLATEGKFEHSPVEKRNGAGENIAAHSNLLNGDEVTEMWYSEIKDYDFNRHGFFSNTGHFTQVVWKDCTHLGVGVSSEKGSHGMYTYVANYWPHGNTIGQFENNVLPKL